jgi:hypothetical protein
VERALGDPGEDGDHRIGPVLLVQVGKPEHVSSIVQESTSQKSIHEKDVANDVDEVHELKEEKMTMIFECQL